MTSETERYLRRFHGAHHAATPRGLGLGRTKDGRDSYALVATAVGASGSVLDLGCGDGALLQRLAQPGRAVAGIDLVPADLVAASRAAAPPQLACARADALPFAEASFDAVVSHLALMLMPVESVLAEAKRVTKPGGRFIAMLQSDLPPQGAFGEFARRMHGALDGVAVPELGDARTFDRQEMDALLVAAGYRAIRYEDARLHFERAHRRTVFETLYGVDLVPEAKRDHVLAAADVDDDKCSVDVRLVTAQA